MTDPAPRPRVGFLGGTFDPPHIGHLLLGECAREQFALDLVLYVPAGEPYHKAGRRVSPSSQRLEMTRLAIEGNPAFAVDESEVLRSGETYTVDTLRALHAARELDIVLILGADALRSMRTWREREQIASLASIVVAPDRGASPEDIPALARAAGLDATPPFVKMPDLEVSSTLIRDRIAAGRSIRYLVPEPVRVYIESHHLYR